MNDNMSRSGGARVLLSIFYRWVPAGFTLDGSPVHRRATRRDEQPLWEEAGEPGDNARDHGENIGNRLCREATSVFWLTFTFTAAL